MSGTTRNNVVRLNRTVIPNRAPAIHSLEEGELAVEMAAPQKLWVGVPANIDGSGRIVLLDTSQAVGVPEAPTDGQTYGRNTGTWAPVIEGPVDGGTF